MADDLGRAGQIEVDGGELEYFDTGGDGPTVVLVHGVLMDASVWRHVVQDLRQDHRCLLPVLPLGGHRRPMRSDADLSMRGIARILGEFLDRLDLRDLTLVFNDWSGPLLLLDEPQSERLGGLVFGSCEAFDNVPPGIPGRMLVAAARVPGALWLGLQQLRVRRLRRLPTTWGSMSKQPIPDEVMDQWFRPALSHSEIRRDLRKYLVTANEARRELTDVAERLHGFDRPALIVWAAEDRVMPLEHGRRFAELLPQARLVEVPDSYTLIPEDQPSAIVEAVREVAPVRA